MLVVYVCRLLVRWPMTLQQYSAHTLHILSASHDGYKLLHARCDSGAAEPLRHWGVYLTRIWPGEAHEAHWRASFLTSICRSSQDLIHCNMQGALNGKIMHVVCVLFSLKSSTQLCNHYRIVEENSTKYVPQDGFFGIQIYQIQFWPGLCPGPRSGSPRPPCRLERDTPIPIPHAPQRLRRFALNALGVTAVFFALNAHCTSPLSAPPMWPTRGSTDTPVVCVQVVGPMADDPSSIFGTYTAHPDRCYVTTPLDGLSRLSLDTRHAAGCDRPACQHYDADEVRNAVTRAQLVVVCLGLGTLLLPPRLLTCSLGFLPTRRYASVGQSISHVFLEWSK